jgi:hypothetical protein
MSASEDQMTPLPKIDPLDRPLRGYKQIADFLEAGYAATRYQLSAGILDANKIGGLWCSTPRRLLKQFGSKPTEAAHA